MMKLYWSPRSRSFSALWLMEETGQPYERVLTDISTGAQKSPEYLAINPMGKVPALSDGDATLAELRGRPACRVGAAERDAALGGLLESSEAVDERGLAGAIRADEAEHFVTLHREAHIRDRRQTLEADRKLVRGEHRGVGDAAVDTGSRRFDIRLDHRTGSVIGRAGRLVPAGEGTKDLTS